MALAFAGNFGGMTSGTGRLAVWLLACGRPKQTSARLRVRPGTVSRVRSTASVICCEHWELIWTVRSNSLAKT